jgi:hypothetical protein
LERSFNDEELSEAEVAQFKEISVPGYQRIGAPRVGRHSNANQWILDARKASTSNQLIRQYSPWRTDLLAVSVKTQPGQRSG